jgi:tetratricopeptide (TPR) repeat protein
MKTIPWILAFSLILSSSAALAHEEDDAQRGQPEQLGEVSFPISCSAQAQKDFDRGMALFHSFWWDEAAKTFGGITQKEPDCAIGYWGSALTALGNLYAGPTPPKALQFGADQLAKAAVAPVADPRERDYIAALQVFYTDHDKLDHRTRLLAFEKSMERLAQRYPDDTEAVVLHALILSTSALPSDKTYSAQLKAAAILEQVYRSKPNHPGVAHYLIHSYDYPALAPQALDAARRYAKIAPSAAHAQHMPSHTYTMLGMWPETIDSNIASAKRAVSDVDYLHALDYLVYAYLQGGQDEKASAVVDKARAVTKPNGQHFAAGYALAAIPARYAIERGDWAAASRLTVSPPEAAYPWSKVPHSEAVTIYARALGAARSGDAAAARRDIARLGELRDAMKTANLGYWVNLTGIQIQVAQAWATRAEGKPEEALALLRVAADLETDVPKHPVMPGPILPAREQLGEMLLEMNRPAVALSEFERSMGKEPNRFRSFYGAARAAELSGNRSAAQGYYERLLELCSNADADRAELRYARTFVASTPDGSSARAQAR